MFMQMDIRHSLYKMCISSAVHVSGAEVVRSSYDWLPLYWQFFYYFILNLVLMVGIDPGNF
jgi:hypothetical protein